jgi:hypothetical protein
MSGFGIGLIQGNVAVGSTVGIVAVSIKNAQVVSVETTGTGK